MKTKYQYLLVLCLFFLFSSSSFSKESSDSIQGRYSQDAHKHITAQAMELLKHQFPYVNFSLLSQNIGDMQTSNGGSFPFQVGKAVTGAFREDEEDVVFNIMGPVGASWYVSNSHFWNADNRNDGDNSLTTLNDIGDYPNAYTKICRYIDGDWRYWNGNGYGGRKYLEYYNPVQGRVYNYSYAKRSNDPSDPGGLINFFKTKKIWLESYYPISFPSQITYVQAYVSLDDGRFRNIVWELVGRMCHLLEDMNVPAHTHNDVHVSILGGDCYEDFMTQASNYNNYTWYTASNNGTFTNGSGMIDPYAINNPDERVRYLMYTANQLADHWPSGPNCSDNPQQHLGNNDLYGGSYPILDTYYQNLGPTPPYISSPAQEGDYCFNHAIRATAGLLYWFAIESGIISNDPASYPHIDNVTTTSPDLNVYRGETVTFTAYPNNPNYVYTWRAIYCDNNNCNYVPAGMNMPQYGNQLTVQNVNYNTVYCRDACGTLLDAAMPAALYFKVEVTARLGSNFISYIFPHDPSDLRKVIPHDFNRPYSGCPYVYVQNEAGQFVSDNNILHRSEFTDLAGQDISDRYMLTIKPGLFNNKISVNLFESTIDVSSINSVKLLAIDHPLGTKIGVTEANDIVMYYDADVESPVNATKNQIEDITQYIQYQNPRSHDTVSGIFNDSILSSYDIPVLRNKVKQNRVKFNPLSRGMQDADNTALIMKIGMDPNLDRPPVIIPAPKDYAGTVTVKTDANNLTTRFARRENPSDVIVPFGQNASIENASIQWNRDYALYYAAVVNIFYDGFDVIELPLSEALNSANVDLLGDLQNLDGYYATLDTTGIIMLKFDNVTNTSGMIRDYILETNGQYAASTSQQRLGSAPKVNSKNSTETTLGFTNKLNANFPNPFNPTTKINYQIKKDGFVSLKIYNVIGQLVKELVGEFKNAGNYIVEFNGSYLASGTYYYRIEANDFIETKKMILIK